MTSNVSPKPLGITLRFTPYAWAKLVYLRDKGNTEVGGWGQVHPHRPLTIIDIRMPKQECTSAWCEFDDVSSAQLIQKMIFDEGCAVEECQRIWIHTHPGNSPQPSGQDEDTWKGPMSEFPWGIMFILARGGNTYARIRYSTPFGNVEQEIPVAIDWSSDFLGTDQAAWDAEYEECVTTKTYAVMGYKGKSRSLAWDDDTYGGYYGTDYQRKQPQSKGVYVNPKSIYVDPLTEVATMVSKNVLEKAHQDLNVATTGSLYYCWTEDIDAWCTTNNVSPPNLFNAERNRLGYTLAKLNSEPSLDEIEDILWQTNLEWDASAALLSREDVREIYGWPVLKFRDTMDKYVKLAQSGELTNPPKGLVEWLESQAK